MLSAIFRFTGRSGPGIAIAGAVLLLVLALVTGIALSQVHLPIDFNLPKPKDNDVRIILWNLRHLDLLGQIVILLGGAFGVVTLFKEWKNE